MALLAIQKRQGATRDPRGVRMTEQYIDTLIRCSSGALKRMGEAAPQGAEMIRAEKFKCPDCGTAWDRTDFDGADRPHLVTCSNCYGKRVLITKMRVCFPEGAA